MAIINGRGTVGIRRGTVIGPPTDSDAQAFITAANITNATQVNAITTLVLSLKSYGIWTKMKAIYPFVGGTASSHKWNLKDPRDADNAFRLTFGVGLTHSSNGINPNGSGYANTFFTGSNWGGISNASMGFYSRTNFLNLSETVEMGGYSNPISNNVIEVYNPTYKAVYAINCNDVTTMVYSNTTDTLGLYVANRTGTNVLNGWKNGIKLGTNTVSVNTLLTNYIYIGGYNVNNVLQLPSSKECAFAFLGDGLTDTEAANLYTAVQTYQTSLGRQVGVPIVSDSDAQAFLNAAVITGTTEANAVNTLVTSLKSAGIWTKMKAIYPFVGGTASSHKFNLKDPRDDNGAYRLTFTAGIVHSSNGILPNGTSDTANTYLSPLSALTQNSSHISYYSRTNNLTNTVEVSSVGTGNTYKIEINLYGTTYYANVNVNYATNSSTSITDSRGLWVANRNSATQTTGFKNGSKIIDSAVNSTGLSDRNILLFGQYSATYYSNKQCAFASIGNGLTDTDAFNLYTAVQTYQTSLGRQV